jgi:uncharacterized protein (DUF1778 family)
MPRSVRQNRVPKRLARIEARVSSEQKRLFEKAAEIEGVTLTDFAVASMHRAATRALQSHHAISLSLRDQDAFMQALMNPPAPNEVLRRAARKYTGTFSSRSK